MFEVLEYMREVRRHITVREASEKLGYPLSSALVLLKSMATLGYLSYDAKQRAYYPTVRLAMLGDWVLDAQFAGGNLFAYLDQVAKGTGETAILGLQNDIYAQYVHVILGGKGIQFNVQSGTRRLLCMSGMGWALLSAQSDADVQRTIQRTNTRLAKNGQAVEPELVLEHVRASREAGYAFSRSTVTEGIGILAVPLPERAGGERLAVGVGGPVERLEAQRDSVLATLREFVARSAGVAR
ncbi:IclR family transcriptional regulator [Verticiella sediminum]